MSVRNLIIFGGGGFGMEAAWVAEEMTAARLDGAQWQVLGYADDDRHKVGAKSYGYEILGSPEEIAARLGPAELWYHCALGNNQLRRNVAERLDRLGWRAATLMHPSVIRAKDIQVGPGCYVGALAILCPACRIGRHVLINQRTAVGHGSELGDFSQVCPGAQINGDCRIGAGALVGSNASIHQGKSVGEGATVGANSLVVRAVAPGQSVMGTPARPFFTNPPPLHD